jgi:hypothetical protein
VVWTLLALRPGGFPWISVCGRESTGWYVLDLDATIVPCTSRKEGAAGTFKPPRGVVLTRTYRGDQGTSAFRGGHDGAVPRGRFPASRGPYGLYPMTRLVATPWACRSTFSRPTSVSQATQSAARYCDPPDQRRMSMLISALLNWGLPSSSMES